MYIFTILFGFLVLALLATLNWHTVKTRELPNARKDQLYYVRFELFRVKLRAAGWYLLFGAMALRHIFGLPTEGVLAIVLAMLSVVCFLSDGILGRIERNELICGNRGGKR